MEERYFFPSHGKKCVFARKKGFLPGRNWEETPKEYNNLTMQTDILHFIKKINVMPH